MKTFIKICKVCKRRDGRLFFVAVYYELMVIELISEFSLN